MNRILTKNLVLAASIIVLNGCSSQKYVPAKSVSEGVTPTQVQASQPASEEVFTFVEQMPEFPGGQTALIDFINKNMIYPPEARENGESGRVMVEFVVLSDGTVTDAKVLKGVSQSIDKEALRVTSIMPRWQPGKQNGRAVNVRYVMPLSFNLN